MPKDDNPAGPSTGDIEYRFECVLDRAIELYPGFYVLGDVTPGRHDHEAKDGRNDIDYESEIP